MGQPGCIARVNQANVLDGYPAEYRTCTVFACSPLLPLVVTASDASLGFTFLPRICPCDQAYDESSYSTWNQPHFVHQAGGSVSWVNSYRCGAPYVAGRDPSWIPALVPAVYRNTLDDAPRSERLAGELPILIALMGFHGLPGRASDVFAARGWHLGQWNGPNRAPNHGAYHPSPLSLSRETDVGGAERILTSGDPRVLCCFIQSRSGKTTPAAFSSRCVPTRSRPGTAASPRTSA